MHKNDNFYYVYNLHTKSMSKKDQSSNKGKKVVNIESLLKAKAEPVKSSKKNVKAQIANEQKQDDNKKRDINEVNNNSDVNDVNDNSNSNNNDNSNTKKQKRTKKDGEESGSGDNEKESNTKRRNSSTSSKKDSKFNTDSIVPKVYSLDSNNNKSNNQEREIILQLPLSNDDIKKYSVKTKDEETDIIQKALLEYNPLIENPKAIMEKNNGEDIEYNSTDARSKFIGCQKCIYTTEKSVIPCQECAVKFELENIPLHLDDAFMKRAEEDATFCRPNPLNFKNKTISEIKLSDTDVPEKYNPNVVSSFSKVSENFGHGTIKAMEEIQSSPFEQSELFQSPITNIPITSTFDFKPGGDSILLNNSLSNPSNITEGSSIGILGTSIYGNVEDLNQAKQFKILEEFNQLDTWPKRTNVYCWWDCHPFNNIPIGIPISYNKRKDTYQVYGCFCSFECALAFKKSDRKLFNISNDIFYDLRKRFGHSETDGTGQFITLKSALPRTSLSIFGGKLTIAEFRKYSCNSSLKCNLYHYPLTPLNEVIELIPPKKNEIHIVTNSPPLKLKRNKPLPGNKNTLEHTLGNFAH